MEKILENLASSISDITDTIQIVCVCIIKTAQYNFLCTCVIAHFNGF